MQITRVLNLTDDEFSKLVAAGETLGEIKRAFEQDQADILSDGSQELIKAIADVATEIMGLQPTTSNCETCAVPDGD